MTPLADLLARKIRETGPLTLADYMTECLSHPRHGYYTTRDPFGANGDFTTAPEISQMFGELLGLALAQSWLDQGAPKAFTLAELGPGRGTLMADILRATAKVPGFQASLTLHLVESSPTLRAKQATAIAHPLTHHDTVDTLPENRPLFLVANEFFDALPIRQFRRDGPAWREVLVGLEGDRLAFGLSDRTAPEFLDQRLADTKHGDIVETSPASQTIARRIGQQIATNGGTALIIDYGNWRSRGDTFQALESHQSVNPLARPGKADLTAHVDFEALARAAAPAAHSDMIPQGVFLERLGISHRARTLAEKLTGDALDSHIAAYHRLTQGDEMGTLFKVMALYPEAAPLPPGFAP